MKCLIVILAIVSRCHADLPSDPEEYTAWESSTLAKIEQQASMPPDDAIPKLGNLVGKLSYSYNREKGDRPVFEAARRQLLGIPSYGEWYASKIRSDNALRKQGRSNEIKGSSLWDFETLAQLPAPETVRVLGSFLDDEEGRISKEELLANPTDLSPIPANALLAGRALASLGLDNPPLRKKAETMGYDDLQPWRLWFAQVQAGTRTFRFAGDPQEYNLAGPISAAKVADSGRAAKESPTPAAPVADAEQAKIPTTAIAIAGALLAAALAFVIRQKKRRGA